jgi:hypothetical protein
LVVGGGAAARGNVAVMEGAADQVRAGVAAFVKRSVTES